MDDRIREMTELQKRPEAIRNVSILAHVDHGKTTLSDSLISSNHIISPKLAGKLRYLDSRPDEQERCITMKASAISLTYTEEGTQYLINLIDSPGHVDFSVDVSAALRLCDGAFLVIDAVEGVCSQTFTVLKQSWNEKVSLCLVLNKVDRLVMELGLSPVEAYKQLSNIIEKVNALIGGLLAERNFSSQEETELEEAKHFFSPEKGNVAFTSAVDRWGFTLPQFAEIYAQKMGFNPRVLTQCLWGEFYYNPKTKKTTKKPVSDKSKPMFVQFILDPLWKLYSVIMNQRDAEKLKSMLTHLTLSVTQKDLGCLQTDPRNTLTAVLNAWIPLEKALLSMAVKSLPSPIAAQRLKMNVLSPDLATMCPELAAGLQTCNSEAPSAIFISKMMTSEVNSQAVAGEILYGFARIYSGTVRSNSEIYVIQHKGDPLLIAIDQVYLPMGQNLFPVESVPAGNIVCIGGLQDIVFKTATLSQVPTCPSFTPMIFSGSPIVKVAIEPQQLFDSDKLKRGLQMLDRSDASVEIYTQDNGEQILAVCGEVHLERCIKDLEDTFAKVPINVSPPIVSFRETISGEDQMHIEVTPNKKCTLKIRATALPEEFAMWLDSQRETMRKLFEDGAHADGELRAFFKDAVLRKSEEYSSHLTPLIAESLISFGPKRCGNNLLLYLGCRTSILTQWLTREEKAELADSGDDSTSSNSKNFSEESILSSLVAGFDMATKAGPLCNEPLHGVAVIVEEVIYEGVEVGGTDQYGSMNGQIIGSMKDACRACVLANGPRLVEGIYTCTVQTSQECVGRIYGVISKRRGKIIEEVLQEGTNIFVCKATLPVAESFGFANDIRKATSGSVVPALEFSHWQMIPMDPFYVPSTQEEIEENGDQAPVENIAKTYINSVRRRKGLQTDEKLVVHAEKQRTLGKNK